MFAAINKYFMFALLFFSLSHFLREDRISAGFFIFHGIDWESGKKIPKKWGDIH